MCHRIFTPPPKKKFYLTFWAPKHCGKFYQNGIKIAAVGARTDRRKRIHYRTMLLYGAVLPEYDVRLSVRLSGVTFMCAHHTS